MCQTMDRCSSVSHLVRAAVRRRVRGGARRSGLVSAVQPTRRPPERRRHERLRQQRRLGPGGRRAAVVRGGCSFMYLHIYNTCIYTYV